MVNSRYTLTGKYEQTRRSVRSRNTVRTAVLGDETQNIYSDRPGFYFARPIMSADENGNALLGPTFYLMANPSAGIMPRPGYRVFYKQNERGEWVITGADLNDLQEKGVDARWIEPNDPNRGFVNLFQIVNLNTYSIDVGLIVNVFPWQYQTSDNVVHFFEGTNAATQVDLADNDFIAPSAVSAGRTEIVPSTANKRRFALLVFNITKHLADEYPLEVYPGAEVDIVPNVRLTINEDLQTCYDVLPTDEIVIPVKAYYLEEGQTSIAGISKDIDVRQFINIPSLGTGAPADATYLVQVADADLPNAQAMGALATGLVKNTTTTGVQSIAVAGTDYTTPTGSENLSNKTITASSLIATALSLLIGGFKAIFSHANTADRTYSFPDVSGTVTLNDAAQTLTGKTIDGDDNTLQDIALTAIKTVGANVKRFITRDASGVISDATNPPLDNLQHNHTNAAGGGTLTGAAFGTQSANNVLAGPTTGSDADPTFRRLIPNDLAAGSALQFFRADATNTFIERSSGPELLVDWQYFSSSGTWNKPANAKFVHVIVVGGGGGGGSGRRGASATNRFGGGGGGAGYVTEMTYSAAQLDSSETITVGAGGTGGAQIGTNDTNGSAGSAGNPSFFGGSSASNAKLMAAGGGGGAGGTNSPTAGGAGATTWGITTQFYGSDGGAAGGATAAAAAPVGAWGPGGGGGGAGFTTGNAAGAGGAGAAANTAAFRTAGTGGGGAGGVTPGPNNGTLGGSGTTDGSSSALFGSGGGGASSGSSGFGNATGADGGGPGGGGGGGSASQNPSSSGAGGAGANGGVFVITYYSN